MDAKQSIVQALFDTRAIRVSPADHPFWYTSGTLGPYYINTHFLYGSDNEANQLLGLIERATAVPMDLPQMLSSVLMEHYQQQPVFKLVIDELVDSLQNVDFDVVSGGERRDFFFSIPVAALLNKPHVAILKDGQAYWSDENFQNTYFVEPGVMNGTRFVHIADLVTEASSYTRTWLPTIHRLGGTIRETAVVVDRDQGGREVLAESGVELIALTRIDAGLFATAQQAGLVDQEQVAQITLFMQDPHRFMTEFLDEHPNFLADQINLGGKAAERARRCLEQGYGNV